jgi:glycosyltransferase involved in cell wall biosynthesis
VIPLFTGERPPGELWIAGSGPQESELRELAGAAPAVRFLGWVPPVEVRALLRAARALIVPSLGFEVFGLVTLEAFREGTPVIARRRGALPEVVESTGGGLLFDTTDQLRAAVERLAGDGEAARTLGARARAGFLERWSEDAFAAAYLGLIAELARQRADAGLLRRLGADEQRRSP